MQGPEEDNPQSFLACDVLSEAEAARVKGGIALVLRGQCSFVTKARNLQVRLDDDDDVDDDGGCVCVFNLL